MFHLQSAHLSALTILVIRSKYNSALVQMHHRPQIQQVRFACDSVASAHADTSASAIMPALRAQYSTCMSLARAVAQLDDELRVLKEAYREVYRRATNSVRDPFQRTADKALAT